MVRHQVEDYFQAPGFSFLYQRYKIVQRSEAGIDSPIVGHIVTEILHRTWEERRYPYGIDAQPGQVFQLTSDTFQIAYTVAVGIFVAPGINLIEHRFAPPGNRHKQALLEVVLFEQYLPDKRPARSPML